MTPKLPPASHLSELARLPESELCEAVVIPLLSAMGYRHIFLQHGGQPEKGKDIVCHRVDKLGDQRYLAVVVKRTSIHGSVGKRNSAAVVLDQLRQALSEPFTDPYSLRQVQMSECWVVTSGRILNTAIDSIRGQLTQTGLARIVRFIDGHRLCELVDEYMPSFWSRGPLMISLSHELAAFAVGALGRIELLRRLPLPPGRSQDLLAGLEEDIMRLMMLRDNTAFASRTSDADSEAHLRLVDVLDLDVEAIQPSLKLVMNLASHKGLEFEVQMPAEPMSLRTDLSLLRLVLYNLIENAVKFSHCGTSVAIEAGSTNEGNDRRTIWVAVSNEGIGIPDDETQHVCRQGYRASNASMASVTGAGLGLYVTEKLTRSLQGKLELLSCAASPERTTLRVSVRDWSSPACKC